MMDFLKGLFEKFEPAAFVDNLEYMGAGMACIFIVIGVIVLSVVVLDKITTAFANRKKNEE